MVSNVNNPRLKEIITADEAAEILGMSKAAVHYHVTNGKIQFWKKKGIELLLKKDVLALRDNKGK